MAEGAGLDHREAGQYMTGPSLGRREGRQMSPTTAGDGLRGAVCDPFLQSENVGTESFEDVGKMFAVRRLTGSADGAAETSLG